ncbi:MlaD family protein [Undibacter mobilis]|uniref:MCE family protein n=1 Tax=Undibacter mobilis TaxID=2292256 RepID=A0A371BBQ8_9BRAD|nr:MlaD family protein [Undibacter mobilis]RDV05026.1 MCE family protein [Undibacter mobilis]
MEDRAKFALIGLFTFAVIAAAFGFIYWVHNAGASKETKSYLIVFEGSVSGLRVGGPVMFNGIRVGEVTEMQLTDKPSEVAAVISITPSTPLRSDTIVTLEYAGLTGIASVSLKGATASSPALAPPKNGGLPTLRAASTAGDMGTAVRETLAKADNIIVENQESLRNAIKNIETFTEALARNSNKIDELVNNGASAMGSINELAVSLKADTSKLAGNLDKLTTNLDKHTTMLAENLDKRTAEITEGVLKVTDSTNKQINLVGTDLRRSIGNIDRAVSDLAKNPQRILFGGGGDNNTSGPRR